jgi:hypothetical protein
MPETTSPAQPSFRQTPCAGSVGYLAPDCYVGRIILNLVICIQELDRLAHSPGMTSIRECPACPALFLLRPFVERIDDFNQLLDDLPAADCPDAASFNLSNIRPSLPTGQGNPG